MPHHPVIRTLAASLVALAASPAVAAEGDAPIPAPAPAQADAPTLEQRLQQLDQEVRILKRRNELAAEESAAKAKEAVKPTAGDGGFGLASADKAYTLRLGLLVQADGRFHLADEDRQGTDTFTLAKVRPQFSGTLAGWLDYRFLPDFAGNAVTLQDAFVDARLHPSVQVLIGKAKVPLGLERTQSDTALLFPERGITDRLVPNRDVGIQLHGDVGVLSYGVGLYNGAADGASRDGDINDDKSVAGRLWSTPFKAADSDWINGLLIGIGGSYGSEESAAALPGGSLAAGYRTPNAGTTFFTYTAGTIAEGIQTRLSPQLHWSLPSYALLADYVVSTTELERAGQSRAVANQAWQVAASWVLTGERPTYAGVRPKSPFAPGNGGWGAWELAARVGQLLIDQEVFEGDRFAATASQPSTIDTWAVGLNWYPTRFLKWQAAYEESIFDTASGATTEAREREHFLITRLSLFF